MMIITKQGNNHNDTLATYYEWEAKKSMVFWISMAVITIVKAVISHDK